MPCASETYIADAGRDGNTELADFFRHAQAESRNGAGAGPAAPRFPALRLRGR